MLFLIFFHILVTYMYIMTYIYSIKTSERRYIMEDRRKHISFKNNERDTRLLEHIDKMAARYGLSSYIKILIEKDMISKEGELND